MKDFAAATVTALCALVLGASANPLYAEYYNQERAVNASATATSTASSNASFPTDVGYPGKTKTGQTPFLAVEDRLPGSRGNSPYENRWNATDANKEQFDLFKSLGNLSPYHSSRLFPETTAHKVLPDTCTVEKAIILHRHGSRYVSSEIETKKKKAITEECFQDCKPSLTLSELLVARSQLRRRRKERPTLALCSQIGPRPAT